MCLDGLLSGYILHGAIRGIAFHKLTGLSLNPSLQPKSPLKIYTFVEVTMATISKVNTSLTVKAGSDRFDVVLPILGKIHLPGIPPSVTLDAGPWVGFDFNSPTIDAYGSIR